MAVQIFGAVNLGKILAAQGLSALKTVGGGVYRVRTLDNGKGAFRQPEISMLAYHMLRV